MIGTEKNRKEQKRMMFCGFCDQPCQKNYEIQTRQVQAYGQKGELIQSMFFCDKACLNACIRNRLEKNMTHMIELDKEISSIKCKKTKEVATYKLTIRSLAIYFKACFERKPKEELEILRDHSKRMFGEAFCYEELIGELSQFNASFLDDELLKAFSK